MNTFQKQFLSQIKYLEPHQINQLDVRPQDCWDLLQSEDAEYFDWLGKKNTLKTYTLIKERKGTKTEISGNLYELMQYFGYTIDNAYHSSVKINYMPKTIKSCLSNIKKALDYREGSCYNRTFIDLKK